MEFLKAPAFITAVGSFLWGPVRAFWLYHGSTFSEAVPQSQRTAHVKDIKHKMATLNPSGYLIVEGPKGVGKTCAIHTAVSGEPGVLFVPIRPGTQEGDVTFEVLSRIGRWTHFSNKLIRPDFRASAVITCFNYWYPKKKPTVVLELSEVRSGGEKAAVHAAARNLSILGLTVVIDASSKSLIDEALQTNREQVIHMDAAMWDEVKLIKEFKPLLDKLETMELSWLVQKVCGGEFATLEQLGVALVDVDGKEEMQKVVCDFVLRKLHAAVTARAEFGILNPAYDEVCKQFKGNTELPASILTKARVNLPTPCKVLRKQGLKLIPVNAPMACILTNGWSDDNAPLSDPKAMLDALKALK